MGSLTENILILDNHLKKSNFSKKKKGSTHMYPYKTYTCKQDKQNLETIHQGVTYISHLWRVVPALSRLIPQIPHDNGTGFKPNQKLKANNLHQHHAELKSAIYWYL